MTTTQSTTTKVCAICATEYPQTAEFWDAKANKNGSLYYYKKCKPCRRKDQQAWKDKNRERVRATNAAYYENNREELARRRRVRKPSEQNKENAARYRREQYKRRCTEQTVLWYANNAEPPKCKCDCGGDVSIGPKGPRDFINQHAVRVQEIRDVMSEASRRNKEAERVPIDKLRILFRDYKDKNGLTWREVADRAGMSHHHVQTLMYDKRPKVKGMSKEWVSRLLERLSGKATTPTHFQTSQVKKQEMKTAVGGLYGLMVVKNEADRYLQACLEWNLKFLDDIFIVDDGSDDETLELCLNYTDNVVRRPDAIPPFMVHEGKNRQWGWESMAAMFELTDRDWILAIDSDEFVVTNDKNRDVREAIDLVRSGIVSNDSWCGRIHRPEAFKQDDTGLYVRTDHYWKNDYQFRLARYRNPGTSTGPRTMAFSNLPMGGGSVPIWYQSLDTDRKRSVKVGSEFELLHVGYMAKEDRIEKHARYTGHPQSGHNKTHIASIITTPRLEQWQGQLPKIWKGLT